MKLQLLNINKFIESQDLKEVTNTKLITTSKGFEPGSLWDTIIFGNVGSNMRKTRFAYINLRTHVIHPQVFNMIKTMSDVTSRILNSKIKYTLVNGNPIEDNENGLTGVSFLIDNFNNIDFTKICKKEKMEVAKYIESNKSMILVDKWVVMPAAYRDADLSKGSYQQVSEINDFYKYAIYLSQQITGDVELDSLIIEKMQQTIIKISVWCQNMLKSKKGIMRGNMLKKTLDYSTRLVATSSPNVPFGFVGLPWYALLGIFEPLVIHNAFKNEKLLSEIKTFLNIVGNVDTNQIHRLIQDIIKNPNIISGEFKDLLFETVDLTIKDQIVIVKRDPVIERPSWYAAHPMIVNGGGVRMNSLDLPALTADCDGDTLEILPLFSEEAKDDARKHMHPMYTKSKWINPVNGKLVYGLQHDAASTVYECTK